MMSRGHRPGAGIHLGDDGGSDDVVAAVVLAADPVQGLDVDRAGTADRRFQFGAAGNTFGHGPHLLVIWVSCRDCNQLSGQLSPLVRETTMGEGGLEKHGRTMVPVAVMNPRPESHQEAADAVASVASSFLIFNGEVDGRTTSRNGAMG